MLCTGCETNRLLVWRVKLAFLNWALIDHADLFIGADSAPVVLPQQSKRRSFVFLWRDGSCILASHWTDIIQFWAKLSAVPTNGTRLDRNKKYLSVIPAEDIYRRDGKNTAA